MVERLQHEIELASDSSGSAAPVSGDEAPGTRKAAQIARTMPVRVGARVGTRAPPVPGVWAARL